MAFNVKKMNNLKFWSATSDALALTMLFFLILVILVFFKSKNINIRFFISESFSETIFLGFLFSFFINNLFFKLYELDKEVLARLFYLEIFAEYYGLLFIMLFNNLINENYEFTISLILTIVYLLMIYITSAENKVIENSRLFSLLLFNSLQSLGATAYISLCKLVILLLFVFNILISKILNKLFELEIVIDKIPFIGDVDEIVFEIIAFQAEQNILFTFNSN